MTTIKAYLPGEREAIHLAESIAQVYGYGNIIAALKRAWALHLVESNPALSYNDALKFADAEAYPYEERTDAELPG